MDRSYFLPHPFSNANPWFNSLPSLFFRLNWIKINYFQIFFSTLFLQIGSMKPNAELFVGISGFCMSVSCMYVYSYFATKTVSEIQSIGDKMYETQWNRYPSEFRMFVQLTISRSQRPLHFSGFGLINCDMVTFLKVKTKTKHLTILSFSKLFNQQLRCCFCFVFFFWHEKFPSQFSLWIQPFRII